MTQTKQNLKLEFKLKMYDYLIVVLRRRKWRVMFVCRVIVEMFARAVVMMAVVIVVVFVAVVVVVYLNSVATVFICPLDFSFEMRTVTVLMTLDGVVRISATVTKLPSVWRWNARIPAKEYEQEERKKGSLVWSVNLRQPFKYVNKRTTLH